MEKRYPSSMFGLLWIPKNCNFMTSIYISFRLISTTIKYFFSTFKLGFKQMFCIITWGWRKTKRKKCVIDFFSSLDWIFEFNILIYIVIRKKWNIFKVGTSQGNFKNSDILSFSQNIHQIAQNFIRTAFFSKIGENSWINCEFSKIFGHYCHF